MDGIAAAGNGPGFHLVEKLKEVIIADQGTPGRSAFPKLLMEHPGQVYSTRSIYEIVWQENPYGSENAVAVHIRHLREKIEINPSEPRYLKVVWGRGYKMEGGK